jgi:hypothetical protein
MQRQLFRSLIRIKLPTREVGLLFKHNVFKDDKGRPRPVLDFMTCKKALSGITWCEVYKILGDGDVSIMVCGRAYCKVPDIFNKKIGRKRALTSALSKVKVNTKDRLFTQEERTLIWNAYWERIHPAEAPLHPYGPVPPAADLVTAEGQVIGGE